MPVEWPSIPQYLSSDVEAIFLRLFRFSKKVNREAPFHTGDSLALMVPLARAIVNLTDDVQTIRKVCHVAISRSDLVLLRVALERACQMTSGTPESAEYVTMLEELTKLERTIEGYHEPSDSFLKLVSGGAECL